MSWKFWKTKPTFSARKAARSSSLSPPCSTPANATEPSVGTSSPASRPSSVVLPLPEGPRITTTSPSATCRSTPESTVSSPAPSARG